MSIDYKDRVAASSRENSSVPPGWLWFITGAMAGGFFAGLLCLKGVPGDGGGETVHTPQIPQVVASEPITPAPPPLVVQQQPVRPPVVEQPVAIPRPPPAPPPPPPPAEPPPRTLTRPIESPTPPPPARPPARASESPSERPRVEPPPRPAEPRFDFYTILAEREEVVPPAQGQGRGTTTPQSTQPTTPLSSPTPVVTDPNAQYMLQLGSFRRVEDAERRRRELADMAVRAEIQTVTINDGEVYHRVRSGPHGAEEVGRLSEQLAGRGINSLTIRLRE